MFLLYVTNLATGYCSVQTYDTAFDRGLMVIMLSAQPTLQLRCAQ